MTRILREMSQALLGLPIWVQLAVGVALVANFFVITQWERLFARTPPIVNSAKPTTPSQARMVVPPLQGAPRRFGFPVRQTADKGEAEAARDLIAKRMRPLVIDDPKVQPDGSILSKDERVFLYGIKPFDSKKVCMHHSGERWACGLHAYATLRNTLAHKRITCDPKRLLPSGVSAVCRLRTIDVAAMLVRDGLAELDEDTKDPTLMDAQKFAQSRKAGIWDR